MSYVTGFMKTGPNRTRTEIHFTVDPSYPGGVVPTVVRIYEMSVTMNQLLNALIQHISVL